MNRPKLIRKTSTFLRPIHQTTGSFADEIAAAGLKITRQELRWDEIGAEASA